MWKNVSAIDLTSIDTVLNVCNIIKVGSILKNTSVTKQSFINKRAKRLIVFCLIL